MDRLQKELNEMDKKIEDLVWDIKMNESKIEKLEKEIIDENELLEFLIRAKKQKEVE